MAMAATKFSVEEPKFETSDGRKEEEFFKDYTTELENWAWSMERSDWVIIEDDATRAAECAGRTAAAKKKCQMIVFTHLFRTFKNSPKGKPCLDAVNKAQPEFATNVWKKLVNVFKPMTAALAVDLTDKLMQEAISTERKPSGPLIFWSRKLYGEIES